MLQWLIDRAKRTPYFHLDGYMNRWWLVPYNTVIKRKLAPRPGDYAYGALPNDVEGWMLYETTDGTGMVSPWHRPIAWLIQKMGFAIRVHEILRSDTGRDPHNHPWPYWRLILCNGYTEEIYNDKGELISSKWHGPGSFAYRPANTWHKLILPEGTTCTTLFITGKKCQRWGFMTTEGFVPYDKYPGRND